MDARAFLGIERVGESTWRLTTSERLITPGKFLFGGCGLGAGVVALEEATGRPTIYAAAHYISYAPLGSDVFIDVEIAAAGRRVTQARARARVGDREVLTVASALGTGEFDGPPWVTMPAVAPPEECPPRVMPRRYNNSIFDHVETRLAGGRPFDQLDGTPGSPNSALWARLPEHLEPTAASLAIVGDLVSGGVTQPLGRRVHARSLDNTIRVANLVRSEWILVDTQVHALVNGFAQGHAFLWSTDGVLLGTASQSMSIQRPDE